MLQVRTYVAMAWLLCLPWLASAGPATPETEIEELVRQRYLANARNDRAHYERLLAPNFRMLVPYAEAIDRKAYLDAEFPPGRPARRPGEVRDVRVAVAGDSATAQYTVVEHYPLAEDLSFDTPSSRLESYVRLDGSWRLLTAAIADVPSWPEALALDAETLSAYVGDYAFSSSTRVTISVEHGQLMADFSGQGKVPLFAESANTFFDKSDSPLARTVFERDAAGQVVAQVYRSHGQVLRARKMK
jgi:hypothetical protein